MSEELPPLPEGALNVLSKLRAVEPPAGVEGRVFEKLSASIAAAAAPVAAGAGAAAAAGLGAKTVIAIAAAAVMAGGAGGVLLGRSAFAPEPIVIEKVRTVEVVKEKIVEVQVPAPVAPPVVVSAKKEKEPAVTDTQLAREREHIDTARSALLHGNPAAATAALEAHAKHFAKGRLAEERESLWVQALVLAGRVPDARAKAAAFHRAYPNSLLGATVDAALPP